MHFHIIFHYKHYHPKNIHNLNYPLYMLILHQHLYITFLLYNHHSSLLYNMIKITYILHLLLKFLMHSHNSNLCIHYLSKNNSHFNIYLLHKIFNLSNLYIVPLILHIHHPLLQYLIYYKIYILQKFNYYRHSLSLFNVFGNSLHYYTF